MMIAVTIITVCNHNNKSKKNNQKKKQVLPLLTMRSNFINLVYVGVHESYLTEREGKDPEPCCFTDKIEKFLSTFIKYLHKGCFQWPLSLMPIATVIELTA